MPPRGLESAVEKTRAAAQLVRDQFGMARADDASTDASTPGTRRGRRGARRRRSRASDTGDPVTAQERADEASAPDSPATPDRPRKRAAASKRDAQPTAGSPRRRLASRGEQDAGRSADQTTADTSGERGGDDGDGGGGGVLARAREAAGTARERASDVVSRGASRLRGQSSAAAASAGPAVGGEGETVDSRNEAAVALDEQLDSDRRITSDDVVEDGDVYRLKDEVAREIAAKDAADQLDEQFDTDIGPDDVTVERQGDEYVVTDVRTSTRADVIEEETAEGQPFGPGDVSAVLTGTSEDGPEFDVELSARARRRLINERVEEQGGIETKDGELIEADPEDLRFDEQGRVVGVGEQDGGDGLVDQVAGGLGALGGQGAAPAFGAFDAAADAEDAVADAAPGTEIASDAVGLAGDGLGALAGSPLGDQVRQRGEFIAGFSDQAAEAASETVGPPVGDAVSQTTLPTTAGLFGAGPDAPAVEADSEAAALTGEFAEGAVEGAAELSLGLPRDAVVAAGATSEGAQFAADAIGEQGVVEGTAETAQAGADLTVAAAQATEQQAREDPAGALGLAFGGAAGPAVAGAALGTAGRTAASGARAASQTIPGDFEVSPSPRQRAQVGALREADAQARTDRLGSRQDEALDAAFADPERFSNPREFRPASSESPSTDAPGYNPADLGLVAGRTPEGRQPADSVRDLPLGEQVAGNRFRELGPQSIQVSDVADQLPDNLQRLAEDESAQASLVGQQRQRQRPDSDDSGTSQPEPQPETFEQFSREQRRRDRQRSRDLQSDINPGIDPVGGGPRAPFDEVGQRRQDRRSSRSEPVDERPAQFGFERFDVGGSGAGIGAAGALTEGANERLETAQTPAAETATAAGLTPDTRLSPVADVDTRPDSDTALGADVASVADVEGRQRTATRATQESAQETANQSQPRTPAPTRPGNPRRPGRPRRPGVPGGPRRPRTPDDDDDDDDDEEMVGLFGAGEAATPFANPVVGGPEAFGVAGGSLVSSDDDDDSLGLGLGVP